MKTYKQFVEMAKQFSNDGNVNLDALTNAMKKVGKKVNKKFDGKRPLFPDLDKKL